MAPLTLSVEDFLLPPLGVLLPIEIPPIDGNFHKERLRRCLIPSGIGAILAKVRSGRIAALNK